MKPSKFETWVIPLFWAAGFGAMISKGFGVPFEDVTGLLYFGFLFAGGMAWITGRDAHVEHIRKEKEEEAAIFEGRREAIEDMMRIRELRHGKT